MLEFIRVAISNYTVYEETVLKFVAYTGLSREEVDMIAEESRKTAMSKAIYLESVLHKKLNPQ